MLIPTEVTVDGRTRRIGTTDFDITRAESAALYVNGEQAAQAFLRNWDFAEWKTAYR